MSTKPYHHGDLRNAVLTAARQALRSITPDQLSLRQLARDAGVSANAPYRHFADRDALFHALTFDGYRSLTAAIRASTTSVASEERIAGLSDAYLKFAQEEPGLFRLMFTPRDSAEARPELLEATEGLFAEIMSAIEADRSTEDDPEASLRRAVAVWATLHGSTMFLLDGTLDWLDSWLRPSGAELAKATRDGFMRNLRSRGQR